MGEDIQRRAAIQDHATFLAGTHDFTSDIEILAGSELVGTILETVMLTTDLRFAGCPGDGRSLGGFPDRRRGRFRLGGRG